MPFVQSKTKNKQDIAYENDGYERDQVSRLKSEYLYLYFKLSELCRWY